MSNQILAPSATLLTPSLHGEQAFPYDSVARRLANYGVYRKGEMTPVNINLNRQSLVDQMKRSYRAHFAAIHGKETEGNIPADVFEKITEAVNSMLAEVFNKMESDNFELRSFTEAGYLDNKDETYKERRQMRSVRTIELEKQLVYSQIDCTRAENALKKLTDSNIASSDERYLKAEQRLQKLVRIKAKIKSDILVLKTAKESAAIS